MMPSSKHDPYQELEAYLRQAQAEVGRAVEDLLASESTGSSSSSAGSRKNSCPDLHSYGGDGDDAFRTPRKFAPTYTSLSAPRPRRSVNGYGGSVAEKLQPPQQQRSGVAAVTNGSGRKRANSDGTEAPCTCGHVLRLGVAATVSAPERRRAPAVHLHRAPCGGGQRVLRRRAVFARGVVVAFGPTRQRPPRRATP
ncbi:uncharacterized protein LOC144128865 isoform X2 [Amblyomma americanum]